MFKALLVVSLTAAPAFAADQNHFRREYLLDLAHDLDGHPRSVPARRLVQREETEEPFSEERKLEVVDIALKLEAELAAATKLSLERARLALDVVLDANQMIERALTGGLEFHGVTAYSQAFHAAALEGVRKERVGLWLSLLREARDFDGRRAVLRATGMIDLANLGDVRFLGFLEARWHLRVVDPSELRDFAKFHLEKIAALEKARVEIEKLPRSDLRRKTLDGLGAISNLLRRQLHELPDILGLITERPATNRHVQQRQSQAVAAWVRLGEDPASTSPDRDEWARQLRAIARELRIDEVDYLPNCKTNLIN